MIRRIVVVSAALLTACTMQRWQPAASSVSVDEHLAHMSAADLMSKPMPNTANPSYQGIAGLPPSDNAAAARLSASPRHGEWVRIAVTPGSADTVLAWVVHPNRQGKAPVVVVIHEIFGLSTWVRSVADQLAADGYIAIAPDLNTRVRGGPSEVTLARDSAQKLSGLVPMAERNAYIAAAANYGMMLPSADQKYAVIGYCYGGSTVWGHAVNGGVKGLVGGVAYYGAPFMAGGARATAATPAVAQSVSADSLAKVHVPVMLLNGSRDTRISAAMPAVDSIMKAMKKEYTGVNYEGAIHGFLRAQDDPATGANADAGPANLTAAKDAWPRTLAFLKKQFGK
jgi:carboxymethylenebutenolidase